MKKLMKITSVVLIIAVVFAILGSFSYYFVLTKNLTLSESNLGYKDNSIEIYNLNNDLIKKSEYADTYVSIGEISDDLKNAFVSIEDKRFYKHHGLDYIRIFGALVNNIKSRQIKEGASTISQQLIKNTHLTAERSINRKIQEAKLALNLEKRYSKDDILEMYLNIIYFGNGIYGVENASQRFFNKSSSNLSLSECAMLAGVVKNPSKYSPVINYNNSVMRRNLVLSLMKDQKMIDGNQFESAKSENVLIKFLPLSDSVYRSYIKSSIKEAANILNIHPNELISKNYKIYTYLDKNLQEHLVEKVFNSAYYKANNNGVFPDGSGILVDNKSAGISAYASTTPYSAFDVRRQPGSAIKPVAVFAPALEYNIITPATQILDEFTDFNNYKPHNYGDVYYGWVSSRDALAKSLNVPAVKILSYLGTDRALDFLNKMGFNTDGEDSSLSLALGGTRKGSTLIEMAGAYRTLADRGNYRKISFIRQIENREGEIVYRHSTEGVKVMSDDNSYLVTDMLKSAVSSGTASKLSYLDIDVAAKTGTVSYADSAFNTDAWSMSYTTEHTLCIWQGNAGNSKERMLDKSITGGGYPTMMARDVLRDIYRDKKPLNFEKPESIVSVKLDKVALNKDHLLMLAGDTTPEEYQIEEIFSSDNVPKETSEYFTAPSVKNLRVTLVDNIPIITFDAENHIKYTVIRESISGNKIIKTAEDYEGEVAVKDEDAPPNTMIKYTVIPKIIIEDREITGQTANTSTVITINLRKLFGINDNYINEIDRMAY